MTLRGLLSSIGDAPAFRDSKKTLKIVLLRSTIIWNSLLIRGPHGDGLRKDYSKLLDEMKEAIRNFSDREFIYFVVTRPRIRIAKAPRSSIFGGKMIIDLEVGKERLRKTLKIPYSAFSNLELMGPVKIDWESTIIRLIQFDGARSTTITIHTLLEMLNIQFGFHSNIAYIGRTNDPGRRVLDGNHRGLSDTLLIAQENNDDVFLFSNIFHARYHSQSPKNGINFVVSNSMTDEIQMEQEAELIEKLFIYYFDPETQRDERQRDLSALRNMMRKLRKEKNLMSAEIFLEMESPNEYYKFGSDIVESKHMHAFSVNEADGQLHCKNTSIAPANN